MPRITPRIYKVASIREPQIGEELLVDGLRFVVRRRLGWQEVDADMPSYVYFDAPTLEGQRRFLVECDRVSAEKPA